MAATATTGLLALAFHNREQPFVVDPRLIVDLSADDRDPVSYTHLTLPTILRV